MESYKTNAWTVENNSFLDQTNATRFTDLSHSSEPISPLQALADKRFSSLFVRAETQRKQANSSQVGGTNGNSSTSNTRTESQAWPTTSSPSNNKIAEIPTKTTGLSPTGLSRLQGLLIGLAVAAVTTGVVAAVAFTRPWESTTTKAPTSTTTSTAGCNSFQWDSVGVVVAGNGSYGNGSNQLGYPQGIFIDSNDILYVADYYFNRIQKWLPNAATGTTVAGRGSQYCFSNNTGLCYPSSVYVDKQQNIFIGDNYGIRLWQVGASSGTLLNGSSNLGWISALDMDTNGNLYACVPNYYKIMMWSSFNANPVSVAGNGFWGYSSSNLNWAAGITVDSSTSTLYIVDSNSYTVVAWKINATTGNIVAGRNATYGASIYSLRDPQDVKRDPYGNIYVLDTENYRIMMYCANSQSEEPRAIIDLGMRYARSMAFDSKLNIYIGDLNNYQVIKFNRLA